MPTLKNWYKNWLQEYVEKNQRSGSSGCCQSERAASVNTDLRHERNYWTIKRSEAEKKRTWLKKMAEKQKQAEAVAAAKIKERKEQVALRNRKQSDHVVSLQCKKSSVFGGTISQKTKNRAEEKAANDVLQTYLMEIRQSYIEKQVEEKVRWTNESKYDCVCIFLWKQVAKKKKTHIGCCKREKKLASGGSAATG